MLELVKIFVFHPVSRSSDSQGGRAGSKTGDVA